MTMLAKRNEATVERTTVSITIVYDGMTVSAQTKIEQLVSYIDDTISDINTYLAMVSPQPTIPLVECTMTYAHQSSTQVTIVNDNGLD